MSKLHNLAKNCDLTNQDEIVNLLFLIHNSYGHVQDELLKEISKDSIINDCLQYTQPAKVVVKSEKLTQRMHSNSDDNVSVDAFRKTKSGTRWPCLRWRLQG